MAVRPRNAGSRGVLLVNLGSPDSPAVRDVRRYLGEFLMDGRVIDVPYLFRRLVVSCFVLPFRPGRSAEAYRSIWWKEGSPLVVLSERLRGLLEEQLEVPVELGMRYGRPSIGGALERLARGDESGRGVEEILLVPLYPHYAMSTYESSVVEVRRLLKETGSGIRLRVLPPFYDDPDFIDALHETAAPHLERGFDHVLFSYHGLPERHLRKTDPTGLHCLSSAECCAGVSAAHATCYRHQVLRTTELLVERARIAPGRYSVAFQSRLGREEWLGPHTAAEIERLARSGVRRLAVMCPAFVTDCLETLEEIGIRGRETFLAAGGREFELVPCLNDHPRWVRALHRWCSSENAGLGSVRDVMAQA